MAFLITGFFFLNYWWRSLLLAGFLLQVAFLITSGGLYHRQLKKLNFWRSLLLSGFNYWWCSLLLAAFCISDSLKLFFWLSLLLAEFYYWWRSLTVAVFFITGGGSFGYNRHVLTKCVDKTGESRWKRYGGEVFKLIWLQPARSNRVCRWNRWKKYGGEVSEMAAQQNRNDILLLILHIMNTFARLSCFNCIHSINRRLSSTETDGPDQNTGSIPTQTRLYTEWICNYAYVVVLQASFASARK